MIVRIAILVAMLSLVSACLGKATYRWKEEVLLHDGRVIVIERSVRTGEVPVELGQPPGESDYTLTFIAEDRTRYSWTGEKEFRPMILDLLEGKVYVVASARTGTALEANGCPQPPYFFFRSTRSGWERVPYQEFPRQIRKANLLNGPTVEARPESTAAVKRGYASLHDVQKSHIGLRSYRREVREDAPNPCATR